jgi:penicillin-binding protein 2
MSARRVAILYAALLFGFAIVLCRIFLLAQNSDYAARAESQSSTTLKLTAKRGNFYDCEGRLLTGLEQTWFALCLPGEQNYATLFDSTLPAQQAILYQKRNYAAPFLLEVTRDLSTSGVFSVEGSRRYCTIPLCQHLIGYLDGDGNGVTGLEAAFDAVLRGDDLQDAIQCTVNAQGRLVENTSPVLQKAEGSTSGIQLTISRSIQRSAEAIAAEMMSTGCILVLDTATAKVRASVSVPTYDPENVQKSIKAQDTSLLNRAFCSYAVGSVFKPVLAAAALENDLGALSYECGGALVLGDSIYHCAGSVAHGETDLSIALQKSCNGYFITLGRALGAKTVRSFAARMGFGQALWLADGLKSAAGVLPSENTLSDSGQFANFCFGQGQLLATPVQVAGMMNTIAAGGVYRTPTFLESIVDETTGEVLSALSSSAKRTVMQSQTAATLRTMLAAVVEEGTGRDATPLHGTAGGKTGTAQTGRYDESGTEYKNLWFAGFYPADDPRYTIVVMQDEQTDAAHSSAAIFSQVCEALYWLDEDLHDNIAAQETSTQEESSQNIRSGEQNSGDE